MTDRKSDIRRFIEGIAALARQDVHNTFNVSTGKGYTHRKAKVTQAVIERHLSGNQPIAVFPVEGDATRIAVLDIDNHGDELTWDHVVEAVAPIVSGLIGEGFRPLVFRSGGGAGIHVWLIWEVPQSAAGVRRFLKSFLHRHDLRDGAESLADGTIEVYPKQDWVPVDGVGNPIALPLARESLPLDAELAPIPIGRYRPPDIAYCYSPNVPIVVDGPGSGISDRHPDHRDPATLNEVLDGDREEVTLALQRIPAESYDKWIRIALILKRSFGADGFALWDKWSATAAEKYPTSEDCRRVWDGLRPSGRVGLGTLFYLAQQGGWNGPTDPVIREMNARFGILTHRNRTLVIVKNGDRHEDDEFEWLAKPVFEDRIAAEKVQVSDAKGDPKFVTKADYWFDHARASRFHRVDFDPESPPGANGKTWNTWTGFAIRPAPGDWSLLQDHMLRNICGGDEELFAWLMNWLALGVRCPGLVIGTAPVLHGFPGTGKGFLANAYGRLWGAHYTSITNESHVSGRFNSHLIAKRFVFIDEGTFGGDRKKAGVIKTRITEPWIILEAKGVDPIKIRNRMIFMIASNEDSIVPADKADRRWQVFDVGDRNREDHAYFGAIKGQLEDGGFEAMLYDLLHRDISKDPDPRRIIKTEALFEQIIRAQGPEVRYLHQILDNGLLPQPEAHGNGPGSTTIKAMWTDLRTTQGNSQYVNPIGLGRFLNRVIPGIKTAQNGTFVVRVNLGVGPDETQRSTRYTFPPLPECRAAFAKFVGQSVPWTNDRDEWEPSFDGQEPEPDPGFI